MHYDFVAPPRVCFGWGRRAEVGELARRVGERAFLVWGSRTLQSGKAGAEIRDSLRAAGIQIIELLTISHEPEVKDVDDTAFAMRELNVTSRDFVLGIGGGSAIDIAKALAAMTVAESNSSVRDYLEGVGRGLKLERTPLPVAALPTTSGTGSEATKNAVISSYDPPFKKSLRSDLLIPQLVLVDPELTVTLPPDITAHTGMDAITQLIESYISRKAKPIPQALAVSGLRLGLEHLARAFRSPGSRSAREGMAQAALLSGMALANSGLGMAHGVAAALGVHQRTRHGLACAVMLPVALRTNRTAAEPALAELAVAAGVVSTSASASAAAEALLDRINALCRELDIPARLSELGVRREDLPQLAAGSRGSSMDGNPRQLSDPQLLAILEENL